MRDDHCKKTRFVLYFLRQKNNRLLEKKKGFPQLEEWRLFGGGLAEILGQGPKLGWRLGI